MSNEVPEFKNEDVKEKLEGKAHTDYSLTFADIVVAQVKSVDMVIEH